MNNENQNKAIGPGEELLDFLAQMLAEFTRNGWGQPGTILEFGASGEFRHRVNQHFSDPISFIDSHKVAEDANCLMLHWEYWPPVEVLEEQPGAALFRAVMWADKKGNSVAVLAQSASPGWIVVPDALNRELDHLAMGLSSTRELEAS